MVKAGAMALKAVVPGIPKSAKDRELLEEDLWQIGCHGLMGKPWGLCMEDMVVELLGDKDNQWHGTVHEAPESGRQRSGGRSTALRRKAREWRHGPTGSLTVGFLAG